MACGKQLTRAENERQAATSQLNGAENTRPAAASRRLGSPLRHPTGVSVAALHIYAHPPEQEGQHRSILPRVVPPPASPPLFQPGKRMTDSRDKRRELLKTRLQKGSISARHQPNVEKQQQAFLLLLNGDANDQPARGE
jgi:hypothetical protein